MDSRSSSFGSRQQRQQRLNNGFKAQDGARDTDTYSSDTFSMQSPRPDGLYDDMSDYSQSVSIGFRPSFPYQMNAAQEAKAAAARAASVASAAAAVTPPTGPPSTSKPVTPGRVYSDGSPRRTSMGTPRRLFGGLKKVDEEKFIGAASHKGIDISPEEPVFFYNPRSAGRRRSCCQEHCGCLGMCVLLVVAIVALTCFIVFITLRPHQPTYELQDAIVSALSIHPQDPADNTTFPDVIPLEELGSPKRVRFGMDSLALRIRNRNSVAQLVYEAAQLNALYEGLPLRQLPLPGFHQSAQGQKLVEFSLPVEEVLVEGPPARNITLDFERGFVTITLKASIQVRVTMFGLVPLPSYRSPLSCFINVATQLTSDVVTVNSKGCS